MSDKKSSKVLWWLASMIALLAVLLSHVLQWIREDDYKWILEQVPYKWQLTIWFMIIISMLIVYFYTKAFPKSTDDTSEPKQETPPQNELTLKQINYRLSGLTKDEKELMRKFYQEDTRTIRLSLRNTTADSLRSIGVLEITSLVSTPKGVSYSVKSIYWDYMKKRPDVIGIDE